MAFKLVIRWSCASLVKECVTRSIHTMNSLSVIRPSSTNFKSSSRVGGASELAATVGAPSDGGRGSTSTVTSLSATGNASHIVVSHPVSPPATCAEHWAHKQRRAAHQGGRRERERREGRSVGRAGGRGGRRGAARRDVAAASQRGGAAARRRGGARFRAATPGGAAAPRHRARRWSPCRRGRRAPSTRAPSRSSCTSALSPFAAGPPRTAGSRERSMRQRVRGDRGRWR